MLKDIKKLLQLRQFEFRGIFISTYIPRRCGIATYTKDLTNAINILNPNYLSEIMALDDEREPVDYPWEVKFRINKEDANDYLAAADYINKSSCDYVSLQHEHGIFGGEAGEYILQLVQHLKKPLITTFHTTLKNPTSSQKRVLKKIAAKSRACVVMVNEAANRLKNVYRISPDKIIVIAHGVPNIPFSPSHLFKEAKGFSQDAFLIGAINLIAPNKGLEYVIQALPDIKKIIPNVKFLMVGQTHPLVKISDDENYREDLRRLVSELDVSENFVEINEYVSLEDLVSYLKALDIYITPYTDLNQTSSGTLAYALGAGKVCISTPYIYAKEALDDNRGLLIPTKSSKAIADAVIKIFKDADYRSRIEEKAYDFGRHMIWEHVGLDYLNLFNFLLNSRNMSFLGKMFAKRTVRRYNKRL